MNGVRTTSARQALAEMEGPATDDPLVLALYDRQRALTGFEGALHEARSHRNQALREALRGGATRELVGQITGLSASRISQILNYRSGHHGS